MPSVISDRLRESLRESELTQQAIADQIGINRTRLSKFLSGKLGLRLSNADALAELLELELVPRSKATGRSIVRHRLLKSPARPRVMKSPYSKMRRGAQNGLRLWLLHHLCLPQPP